jgi:hypothetical protein
MPTTHRSIGRTRRWAANPEKVNGRWKNSVRFIANSAQIRAEIEQDAFDADRLQCASVFEPDSTQTKRTLRSTSWKAATALSPAAWHSESVSNGTPVRAPVPWPVVEDT